MTFFSLMTLEIDLARYYDPEKRCFNIKTKNGKNDMLLYVPTIGTTSKVFNFMQKELQKKKNTDFNNIYAFKEYSSGKIQLRIG